MFRGNSKWTEAARLLFLLAVLMSFGPASSIPVGLLTAGVLGKFGTSEGTTVVMSDAGLLPAEEAEALAAVLSSTSGSGGATKLHHAVRSRRMSWHPRA